MKNRISINEAYFGIAMLPASFNSRKDRYAIETYNLFDFARVKWSVAKWITMKDADRKNINNPLTFMFGDVWGRSEFECILCPWPYYDDAKVSESGIKVDVFQMYVEPNKDILMDIVSRITKTSAQKYMYEWRKKYRR